MVKFRKVLSCGNVKLKVGEPNTSRARRRAWSVFSLALLPVLQCCFWTSHAFADTSYPSQSISTGEIAPPPVEAPQQKQEQRAPFPLQVEENHRNALVERDDGRKFSLSEEARQTLARYQLELIVDHSMSMGERDCPGDQSRWRWCGAQAEDLARAISPYSKQGVTITSFAGKYDVFENVSAEGIEQIFRRLPLTPITRLSAPLKARLEHFYGQRSADQRPLLLAIITDGMPFPPPEPIMVRHQLSELAKKVQTPGEVTVIFLQIGKFDWLGRAYLHSLEKQIGPPDNKRYLVQCVSFKTIQAVGLGNALVQAVQNKARQF